MNQVCGICGEIAFEGTTTFTVDYGNGIIVVRNVPAMVCTQCGETWLTNGISEQLEQFVDDARKSRKQVEVIDFSFSVAA